MTQDRALDILKSGANVFLTGEPGAGKTYVINQYVNYLEAAGLHVAVTASTGIAATHIGGMTIHSWSGVGIKDYLSPQDLDAIAGREKVVKRVNAAQVLVIDEISMLDGKILNSVDKILRTIRTSEEPFGGIQVVCIGDFFQLPPVTRQGDIMTYAFMSEAWLSLKPLICYLSEQHRQEDEMFLSLLNSIRKNEIEEDHYTLLEEQTEIAYEEIEPTRLYTHNADVDTVNNSRLAELPGPIRKFQMDGKGSKPLLEGLIKNCLSPQMLELKEDAMVMCTKNNFEAGYVNGTLARVVRFEDGQPVIETTEGKEIIMQPTTWEIAEDKKVLASIEQLPLRLAWAITVHKSQGMSLDAAEIDLSKAFVYGQGYVALSRVRSLQGLKVLGMHPNALQVDPLVVAADVRFHALTEEADEAFDALEEEGEVAQMHERFVVANGGKVPDEADLQKSHKTRVAKAKTDTYVQTKELLLEERDIGDIARLRDMTEQTVWSHVEKLTSDGVITADQIVHLEPTGWSDARSELFAALAEHGDEKLKPIFEACEEEYDYNLVRLARMQWQLEKSEVEKRPF